MNYTPTSSETWERGEGVGGVGDRTGGGGGFSWSNQKYLSVSEQKLNHRSQ